MATRENFLGDETKSAERVVPTCAECFGVRLKLFFACGLWLIGWQSLEKVLCVFGSLVTVLVTVVDDRCRGGLSDNKDVQSRGGDRLGTGGQTKVE